MEISDLYDIKKIIIDLEVALCIDGKDYSERNIDKIISDVKKRLIKQYQLDLTKNKITDEELYIGNTKASAQLFLENIASFHSKLAGYLSVTIYNRSITIKPINVNFLGFDEEKFLSPLRRLQDRKYIPTALIDLESIKNKLGSIPNCDEKRLFLLMIIAHELGFDELMSVIAQILYLGGKY